MHQESPYIVGIDLGTTNCTVAYLERSRLDVIEQLEIEQFTALKSLGSIPSLPSFLYFPIDEEKKGLSSAQKEGIGIDPVLGAFAKERSSEVIDRSISSAKSWLCHQQIDRRRALLPLVEGENPSDFTPLSPLEAISQLLAHLKGAWNRQFPAPLEEQTLLVTVPASFDPSARQLVQEACQMAGLESAILLEEPQAAFYAWLQRMGDEWRKALQVGDLVLVVDIGGGTSDFSLIEVKDENGQLALERLAVGQHLLLGGDNIDLALAYLMQNKFEEMGHSLEDWQFKTLQQACRKAKETLLDPNLSSPKKSVDVTIKGRGSKLIGNALKAPLSLEEIWQVVLDGFIPLTKAEEQSTFEGKAGFKQIGLPYAMDARISCQIAKFLSMTGEGTSGGVDRFLMPTKVLFNGGTLKAPTLRKRLLDLLNQWAEDFNKPAVVELEGADYDFAVSRGAVYYALAREDKGIRIRSGTSRSYFIGVEEAVPAVPGIATPVRAVCIAPFGMEEGSEVSLSDQQFQLRLGQMATFRFFSHATGTLSDGKEPTVGFTLKQWKRELTELHPIETLLEASSEEERFVSVTLKARVTELGVLELYCESPDGRLWKLEFDIRKE
ncbi:MAG: dnak5 [Chlamydiales bacterium]|jgi:hypothetical protein|nr:dnak5 [Chlamydiales bacterium]